MRTRISRYLMPAMFFLGALAFMPGTIMAGDPGSQNGNTQNAFQFCLHETGDTYYYRSKPQDCKCPKPRVTGCTPRTSSLDHRKSGQFLAATKPGGGGPETMTRQASGIFLSLLMLTGGLVGVAFSVRKLFVRPALGSKAKRRRSISMLLHPRAAGLAGIVAVIAMASVAWSSIETTSASVTPVTARLVAASSSRITAASAAVPVFSSALQVSGTGTIQIGGTAIDKTGNTYVAGGFNGVITFETTPQPTELTSNEGFDVFVAKYNPAGQALWARMANGAINLTFEDPDTNLSENFSFDGALALAVDDQGNAYVGGGFVKSLTFANAAGDTVGSLGDDAEAESDEINFELFVAKYDAGGTLVWARGGDSGALDDSEAEEDLDSGINGITNIVLDQAGNPYVAGTFSGTNFLGQEVTTEGGRDVLLSRLDPASGTPVWVSTPGSANTDAATGLAIDAAANLYLIGDMGGTITFPTQPAPTSLILEDEYGDAFIAKYDKNGQPLFAKQVGGTQPIDGTHLAVSGAGEIYLTGAFAGTAEFDSITVTDGSAGSGASGFLTKYTTDGNALWVRTFGRADEEASEGDTIGYRLAVDAVGSPYLTGVFEGETTFGLESGSAARTLISGEAEDKFLAHYDAAGNFLWVKQPDESGSDGQGGVLSPDTPIEVVPMRLDYNAAAKAMILTGDFQGTLKLDDLSLVSGGSRNAFVATLPLAQAPTPASTVQFDAVDHRIGEGSSYIQITATRSGDVSAAASVDYTTSDGTASQSSDYQLSLGTLRFAPGETSKTIRVFFVDDGFTEGTETINLTLSNPTGTAVAVPDTSSISITDNDPTAAATNPIDDARSFVRQHYLDFLNREPDQAGWDFWTDNITKCNDPARIPAGQTVAQCIDKQRETTSGAFFHSPEFQYTGYYVYCVYKGSLGRMPTYLEFMRDVQQVSRGIIVGNAVSASTIEANRAQYLTEFVQGGEFANIYGALTNQGYVDKLFQTTGTSVSAADKQALVNGLDDATETRSTVLHKVVNGTRVLAEGQVEITAAYGKAFCDSQFSPSFVQMEYFGYLRRNEDTPGFNFWLDKLNFYGGDFIKAEMVRSFLLSPEYRGRFGTP
jgi:hypothetical protein